MSPEIPESPLPREPEYWERLAERISAGAAGPLAARTTRERAWHEVLGRRAAWLVAASLAAMLLLWSWLPSPLPSPAFRWMERAVAPDDVAGTLVGPAPPAVELVLAQFPPAAREEGR